MKRLHLLRHAKSSWDDPALADHDRPLAPRGLRAAKRLAAWAEQERVRPQLALCSPARRTTETLDRLLVSFGAPDVLVEDELYHAGGERLLERVRQAPDAVGELIVVGHNPGLMDLCLLVARPGDLRERVAAKLPTGALATLDADIGCWRDLGPGKADIVALVYPRELG